MKTFFQVGIYEDLQDLVNQLQEQIKDGDNPTKIIVGIADNNADNIKTIKQLF